MPEHPNGMDSASVVTYDGGDDGADEHLMFWVVASRTVVVDEFRWCVLRNRSELSPLLEWKLTAFLEDRDHV